MYSVLSFGQNSPQIYNNFFFGWKINESWSLGSELSYNFLYNEPSAWNELSLSTVARRTLGKVSMVTGGLYFGNTRQNKNLSKLENKVVPSIVYKYNSGVSVESSPVYRQSLVEDLLENRQFQKF